MFIKRELPASIARNTRFSVGPCVDSMDWVASLVSTFAKRLVKREERLRVVESTEKKNIELYYSVPSRPVDHLFTFLGHYLPWFNQFIVKERAAVKDVVTVENVRQNVIEHYHLLPMEGEGYEVRYYLMSWDGQYYDGSPTEWNDLKKIRDYIGAVDMADPNALYRLKEMHLEMKVNRERLHSNG